VLEEESLLLPDCRWRRRVRCRFWIANPCRVLPTAVFDVKMEPLHRDWQGVHALSAQLAWIWA
ncbi:hypothetical protein ACLOJK_022638, partial [Asimina triloba]